VPLVVVEDGFMVTLHRSGTWQRSGLALLLLGSLVVISIFTVVVAIITCIGQLLPQ